MTKPVKPSGHRTKVKTSEGKVKYLEPYNIPCDRMIGYGGSGHQVIRKRIKGND